MKLSIMCASTGGHEAARETWYDTSGHRWPVVVDNCMEGEGAGYLQKVQRFYEQTEADVIAYFHSDLFLHEQGWDRRLLAQFDDPRVGVVGFVGATGLGTDAIYKLPYDYRQLARQDVFSNLIDAEVHGQRDPGVRPVAVVDSCAVVVRRSLLARCGGWPVGTYPNNTHCSDLWLCCMARRMGYGVRLLGISATHTGGGKGAAGSEWLAGRDSAMHQQAHVLIYRDFRDLLPIRVRS